MFWDMDLSGSKYGRLRRVSDGALELPQVGDILILSGGTGNLGHVGIVLEVRSNSIVVAQQNTVNPQQEYKVITTQLAGTKTFNIAPTLSGHQTKGFFTRKGAPVWVPAIGGVAPVSPKVSTQAQSVALVTSGISNTKDITVFLFDPSNKQVASFSVSGKSLSLTPAGMVFSAKLATVGKWSVQLQNGGLTSQKVSFTVQK